jgi:DNA-binding CsgD family transcriptional regulator
LTQPSRLCRQALEQAEAYPPELCERLAAELACNGFVQAATIEEARRYARPARPGRSALELWRVTAAMAAMADNQAAAATVALLRPVLEQGALAAEAGSLVWSVTALTLIAEDELGAARAQCEALIDVARPRGWLMALTHGSMFRSMALIRAGEIRDAEADARLAFEHKLPVSPALRRAKPAGGRPRPAPPRARGGRPQRHAADAARAREELRAIGARPRRSALSGPGTLTPAEHRVAQLAARGHGNRAIAERLFVTQRTVETHLTHAFQKLDIRSRAELGAALEPRATAAGRGPASASLAAGGTGRGRP